MKRQPTWDKYEVALLVEAYLAIERDKTKKLDVLQELSNNLRKKASNEGMTIDNTFRNLNGMQWQLGFIKCAFTNSSVGNHQPSKMFCDIVNMYLNDREKYDEILSEAKARIGQCEDKSEQDCKRSRDEGMRKDRFIIWLEKENISEQGRAKIISTLEKCSQYGVTHKKMKLHIWDIGNVNLYESVIEGLLEDKFLKLLHKDLAYALKKCAPIYAKFLHHERVASVEKNIPERVITTSEEPAAENMEKKIIKLVGEKFTYGYRLGSPIERMKLRTYIAEAKLEIAYSDEEIEQLIRTAGVVTNGKVFVAACEVEEKLNDSLSEIFESGVAVIYYESYLENNREWLDLFHVVSEELLKELLMKTRRDLSYSKNFFSNGEKRTEDVSVAAEICRVWGTETIIPVETLSERLPYIPFEKLRFYLSVNRLFAWVSEGVYSRIETLVVTDKEEREILEYVYNECEDKGYASLSNIPLGDIVEQNYELSETAIFTSVYNKYLMDDYFLNGKILTREKMEVDANLLLSQIFIEQEECTLDEALEKVEELTGTRDRRIAYPALYNTMIRLSEQQFVSDKAFDFDVVATDEVIGTLIKGGFAAIKEITTFATFPTCGQKWNHYLLESYCYRVSKKYAYRTNLFNGRNAGAIVEQTIGWDYKELLAQAVARTKIRLEEDEVGQYLFETGYMAKSKFSWTEDITERAKQIREENV